jgi:hypothetical protein
LRDLFPDLPGDVLLIFTEVKNHGTDEDELYALTGEAEDDSFLLFEWVTFNDTLPLINAHAIPQTELAIMPCFGSIYRCWDYPTIDGFAYPDVSEHIPAIIEATKIGGMCPRSDYREDEVSGVYLCSLSSLDNQILLPFPFLNHPEPIRWDEWLNGNRLLIGDVGLINLFLQDDGTLRWTFHV